jgi:hypothetical protein
VVGAMNEAVAMYKVTAAQRQRIFAVAKEKGLSEYVVKEVLYQVSGQGTTAQLSRGEAEEVIARLKDLDVANCVSAAKDEGKQEGKHED